MSFIIRKWQLFLAPEDKTGYRIGYAWSKDGINWVKSPDNPIIDRGDSGSWDAGKVSCHIIYQTGPDSYNIYYSGASAANATYRGIGLVQGRLHRVEYRKR